MKNEKEQKIARWAGARLSCSLFIMQCFSLLSLCNDDDEEENGISQQLKLTDEHTRRKSLLRHAERPLQRAQVGRDIIDWRHKSLVSMSLTGTQSLFHHNWEGKKQSKKWKIDYERDWENHKHKSQVFQKEKRKCKLQQRACWQHRGLRKNDGSQLERWGCSHTPPLSSECVKSWLTS